MGVLCENQDKVADVIISSLAEIGLRARSVDDIRPIGEIEEFEAINDHLFSNVLARPKNDPKMVWGTIHIYLADGEA